MAAPTSKRAETRRKIVGAAAELFRTHGIDGVGVDAIMKHAGLTHGGFYLHFPSKDALAAEAARSLLAQSAAKWESIGRSADRGVALERIVAMYLDPVRAAAGTGCPLTTLGPDVARRPASRAAIGDALRDMLGSLGRALPPDRRGGALAALSTLAGAAMLSRLTDDPALAEAFLEAAAAAILPDNPASIGEDRPAGQGAF